MLYMKPLKYRKSDCHFNVRESPLESEGFLFRTSTTISKTVRCRLPAQWWQEIQIDLYLCDAVCYLGSWHVNSSYFESSYFIDLLDEQWAYHRMRWNGIKEFSKHFRPGLFDFLKQPIHLSTGFINAIMVHKMHITRISNNFNRFTSLNGRISIRK